VTCSAFSRSEQRSDAHSARGLAKDRDVLRIAPEGLDVVADPFERSDLVPQAGVRKPLARDHAREVEEAEGPEPVVDGHHDDVSAPRQ
jgi:hypothetical protein